MYYYDGRYLDAAASYEKALAIQSTDFEFWGYLASAYKHGEKPDRALDANKRAIEIAEEHLALNPRDGRVMLNLVGFYIEVDNPASALIMLQERTALDVSDPLEMFLVGDLYEQLDRRNEALR